MRPSLEPFEEIVRELRAYLTRAIADKRPVGIEFNAGVANGPRGRVAVEVNDGRVTVVGYGARAANGDRT